MKDSDVKARYIFERELRNLRNNYKNFIKEERTILNSYTYQYSYSIAREGYSIVSLPLISISICRDPRSTTILNGDFILRIEFLLQIPINIMNAFKVMDNFAKDSYPKISFSESYIIFLDGHGLRMGVHTDGLKHFNPRLTAMFEKLSKEFIDYRLAHEYVTEYFQLGKQKEPFKLKI